MSKRTLAGSVWGRCLASLLAVLFIGLGIGCATVATSEADERAVDPLGADDRIGTPITSVLAEGLIERGVIAVASDLAGLPLTFRVLGPDGLWLARARVVVDFGELGRMVIGTTDEDGEITLSFSEALLRFDPVVAGEADGQLLDVHFRFTAPVHTDSDG